MTPEQRLKGKDPKKEYLKAFEILTELRKLYLYDEPLSERETTNLWIRACEFLGAPELTPEERALTGLPSSMSLGGAGTGRKTPVAPNYDRKKIKNDVINFDTNKEYFD